MQGKRWLSIILSLAMVLVLCPVTTKAATNDKTILDISHGSINITSDTIEGYDVDGKNVTTVNNNGYTIIGESNEYTISVSAAAGKVLPIEIDGLTIDVTNAASHYASPFEIAGDNKGTVSITLSGTNSLKSSLSNYAGIQKCGENGTLEINGSGTLTAEGGDGAAGIGGAVGSAGTPGAQNSASNIYINGGTITAIGKNGGAAIGGGPGGAGHDIVIRGGQVTATGDTTKGAGAGIGGGSGAEGYNIKLLGGTINATGSIAGAGIGGGAGEGHDITIDGANVTATGGMNAAGIGGGAGKGGHDIQIKSGWVRTEGKAGGAGIGGGAGGVGENIDISGGDIKADGGYLQSPEASGAGIGGGSTAEGKRITITDGDVTATGAMNAAGIGGGFQANGSYITISGGIVRAKGCPDTAGTGAGIGGGVMGSGARIYITGGTVYAYGGGGTAAGIGGGGSSGDKLGTGQDIHIEGGTVTAVGGSYGAGIGGGVNGNASGIFVTDGNVIARGGAQGGAGIGGGAGKEGVGIFISGGSVEVSSTVGDGIGRGAASVAADHARNEIDGENAVVYTTGTDDDVTYKRGIVYENAAGKTYGDITFAETYKIDSGKTLTVSENSNISINEGVDFYVDGKLVNNGKITNKGNVIKSGTIEGTGKFILTATKATASNKKYDGNKNVTITGVTLEGAVRGDDVSVNTSDVVATVSSDSVGTYTRVSLSNVTLTGKNAARYELADTIQDVPTNVSITSASNGGNAGGSTGGSTGGDASNGGATGGDAGNGGTTGGSDVTPGNSGTPSTPGSNTSTIVVKDEDGNDIIADVTTKVGPDGKLSITQVKFTEAGTNNKNNMTGKISGKLVSEAVKAAGTDDVEITVVVTDGNKKCKLVGKAGTIAAGNRFRIMEVDKKTGAYLFVNKKVYSADELGNVYATLPAGKNYRLVSQAKAAQIEKSILKTGKLAKNTITIKKGKTKTVQMSKKLDLRNVQKITYTSSKKSVAKVNSKGVIKGVNRGTATIKVKVAFKNGSVKTLPLKVIVK